MTEEQIALARRAVACRGWRWMRGMSNHLGQVISYVDDAGMLFCGDAYADTHALPDLEDPATLGCLLALVREAWDDAYMRPERWLSCSDNWTLRHYETRENMVWFDGDDWTARTEAKVLVLALEDAPCGR